MFISFFGDVEAHPNLAGVAAELVIHFRLAAIYTPVGLMAHLRFSTMQNP